MKLYANIRSDLKTTFNTEKTNRVKVRIKREREKIKYGEKKIVYFQTIEEQKN